MPRRGATAALGAVLLLLCSDASPSQALPIRRNAAMNVAVAVNTRCAMAASTLVFPDYVMGQTTADDAVGNITVDCDPGRSASIRIDQGLNPAPGSTTKRPLRRMTGPDPSFPLNYNLYEDAARTIIWDDDRPGVKTARAWPVTLQVYGRVFPNQNVPNGTYSDTVQVNIFY